MQEVAADVFCVEGTAVNWVLLRDRTELTLIDAGWVGDTSAVEDSIRVLGRHPLDVQAVLLTHAHLDHMGAINHFHDRYDTPVFMSSAEDSACPAIPARGCTRPAWQSGAHRLRGTHLWSQCLPPARQGRSDHR